MNFAGYQDQPASLLADCHLDAQPSLSEGFGIALVEAMGCALPVIASGVGGMVEIVEQGRTGWILPAPNAGELAAAIRHTAALDPAALAAIGRAARRRSRPASRLPTISRRSRPSTPSLLLAAKR